MAETDVPADGREPSPDGRAYDLHAVVVDQEVSPTRCTVYPRHADTDERTTTWLSADFSAFSDLERMC